MINCEPKRALWHYWKDENWGGRLTRTAATVEVLVVGWEDNEIRIKHLGMESMVPRNSVEFLSPNDRRYRIRETLRIEPAEKVIPDRCPICHSAGVADKFEKDSSGHCPTHPNEVVNPWCTCGAKTGQPRWHKSWCPHSTVNQLKKVRQKGMSRTLDDIVELAKEKAPEGAFSKALI